MSLIRVSRSTAANSILTHRFNQHEFSLQRCHKRTLASLLRLFFSLDQKYALVQLCVLRLRALLLLLPLPPQPHFQPRFKADLKKIRSAFSRRGRVINKNGHKRTKEAETKMFDNNLTSLASWARSRSRFREAAKRRKKTSRSSPMTKTENFRHLSGHFFPESD